MEGERHTGDQKMLNIAIRSFEVSCLQCVRYGVHSNFVVMGGQRAMVARTLQYKSRPHSRKTSTL